MSIGDLDWFRALSTGSGLDSGFVDAGPLASLAKLHSVGFARHRFRQYQGFRTLGVGEMSTILSLIRSPESSHYPVCRMLTWGLITYGACRPPEEAADDGLSFVRQGSRIAQCTFAGRFAVL